MTLSFDLLIFSERPDGDRTRPSARARHGAVRSRLDIRRIEPCPRRRPGNVLWQTMPWVKRPANGSSMSSTTAALEGATEEAGIEQMQHCVLDAADILVHGRPALDLASRSKGFSATWSASRSGGNTRSCRRRCRGCRSRARRPRRICGQVTCFHVGWRSSGLPTLPSSMSSGSVTGS